MKNPFGGGGRERDSGVSRQNEVNIADPIDANKYRISALDSQLAFLASDTQRVPDDRLSLELGALHPELEDVARQGLVGRVLKLRHPEQVEPKGS